MHTITQITIKLKNNIIALMFVDQTTMSHLVEPVSSVLTVGTATMGDAVLLTVVLACALPIQVNYLTMCIYYN